MGKDAIGDKAAARQALVEMAMGFFRGKVLCAAVRLGIPDALAARPLTVVELAEATQTNPDALRRFLRGLASLGVAGEVAPGRFGLTAFGDPLRKDAPESVWASMVFWADLLADDWTYLADCVRAGDRSGAEAARARAGAPSRWSLEPEGEAIFSAVFAEPTPDDLAAYAAAWDFSRCRVVADLGGGGGGLLAAILMAQPRAHGILVERQRAIDGATKRFAACGLTARCECVAGDLLQAVPAGADTYLMSRVLHGCDDETALKILANVRRAMAPDGRLLIVEVVLPDQIGAHDPETERQVMSDLNMLAVTHGRERSRAEWSALLASAGMELKRILPVAGQVPGIVEVAPRG